MIKSVGDNDTIGQIRWHYWSHYYQPIICLKLIWTLCRVSIKHRHMNTQTNRHTDTCLTSLLPQSLPPYQLARQTGSQIQQIGASHTSPISHNSPTSPKVPHTSSHPPTLQGENSAIIFRVQHSSWNHQTIYIVIDCPCLKSLTNYTTSIVKTPQDWWLVITLKRKFYQDLELMFSCYVDAWWRFRS